MKYKVMIGGQKYKILFNDHRRFFPIDPDRDVIEYTVL